MSTRHSPPYAGLPGLRPTAKARGLRLQDVAARVGVHPSHLSLVATGQRVITPALAARLTAVLDCGWPDLQPFYRRPAAALDPERR